MAVTRSLTIVWAFFAAGFALAAAAPCGDGVGSCPVYGEAEVSLREADEAEALKVQLLQAAGLQRGGSPLRSGSHESEECADSDEGIRDAAAGYGLSISACAQVQSKCHDWVFGPVAQKFCCATCSAPGPTPAPTINPRQTPATRICIDNKAGFVLSWKLWNTKNNQESSWTNNYPAPNMECRGIDAIPDVERGDPVVTIINAVAGKTMSLRSVIYDPEANPYDAANFTCRGGTGGYSCTLGDGEDAVQLPKPKLPAWSPAVTAKSVCVNNNGAYRLRFQLWDTATNNVGALSNGFNKGSNRCQDGADLYGVREGHPLAMIAYVQGGGPLTFKTVIYDPSASAATFTCSGATGGYDCTLNGA